MTISINTSNLDATIEFVIARKQAIAKLQDDLEQALDSLRQAVDNGNLDPAFKHNDAAFDLRAGRVTYDYPADVTALSLRLKDAQAAAVADGTATQKRGEPFWTIKLPKA
jgi:predicted transcriptional regulator